MENAVDVSRLGLSDIELKKRCISCHKIIGRDFDYCPYCGTLQSNECLNCGATLQKDFMFCPKCGEKRGEVHKKKNDVVKMEILNFDELKHLKFRTEMVNFGELKHLKFSFSDNDLYGLQELIETLNRQLDGCGIRVECYMFDNNR